MFHSMLLFGWTLMHVYAFGRAATIPALTRRVPRRVLFAVGLVLWASFLLLRWAERAPGGLPTRLLELALMDWLAALFLVCTALLAADLVTGFGYLWPKQAAAVRGWALVVGGGLSLVAMAQGLRPPVVERYEVRLPGLPAERDGTVVVAMGDLHLGSQLGERWLRARVEQVKAESPDLVVLLGDVVEGHGEPQGDLLSALRGLSAPLGLWAVAGNHEAHGGDDTAARLLEAAGFQLLDDRWAEVCPGLVVAGVSASHAWGRPEENRAAVAQALAGRPPGAVLLLSHLPRNTAEAAAAGVGLMLCGHTHGGQIWPFGYLVRWSNPLLAGRYDIGNLAVIISRGAGTWGPRMRLWQRGEILRVTLRR
jgi:predicted MPP superfamily phosphohydrolase